MTERRKIVIVGGHEQACQMSDYLQSRDDTDVVLCIIRKDDTGIDGVFPSLLLRAQKYNIPVLKPEKLNIPKVLEVVKQLSPDIILSLQNNMIFGEEWISFMGEKLGIVNVHYAPLPKYGGYWPEMWAIWNNEDHFAVTMHYIEKGLDTGPIISQSWFDIDPKETRQSLYVKSTNMCFTMLKENLSRVLKAKVEGQKQIEDQRTYFPKSLPNDGYLDLSWEAEVQDRFIRAIAFPGFPGPKIKLGNQIVTILCEDIPFFSPVRIK